MIRGLAEVVAAPLLIAQGQRVRKLVMRLEAPSGPTRGRAGSGPRRGLLVIGDSAAAGVGAAAFADTLCGRLVSARSVGVSLEWALLAQSGRATRHVLRALGDAIPFIADEVVTSIGANDVTARTPLARFVDEQRRLVGMLRERFSARRIVLSGLPPMGRFPALPQPLRWFIGARAVDLDGALARVAEETGCLHLPIAFDERITEAEMASDGFHPGPLVYAEWARVASARLDAINAGSGSVALPT